MHISFRRRARIVIYGPMHMLDDEGDVGVVLIVFAV